MGSHSLAGMMEGVDDLEVLLEWHLSENHYPPVPHCWVAVCKKIVEDYSDDPAEFDWDGTVTRPAELGAVFEIPIRDIVETLHLGDIMEDRAARNSHKEDHE